jgi:hypothetical protein
MCAVCLQRDEVGPHRHRDGFASEHWHARVAAAHERPGAA